MEIIYRKQLNFLDHWFSAPRRKPLIIRGARQVGKSTLVRSFAQQKGLGLVEVNLERAPQLESTFESLNPQQILDQIEALQNKALQPGNLLFLDEIQATPRAVAALRYFYEDMKEQAVVCAGSLLEFVLADHDFSMPVGRIQYLHMGPMAFTEFLEALDEKVLKKTVDTYERGKELGPVVHARLLHLLRLYYFVGGMPEAVAAYATHRRLSDASAVHAEIINTYRDDFPKYAGSRDLTRLLAVFTFAAQNVGVKIKYSNILKDERSETLRRDIELLSMARVISKVVHTHASGLPLQANLDPKTYKLLFLDVGLMNALCGLKWDGLSAMDEERLINSGVIAEQFVGQHLQDLLSEDINRELTYWLRENKTGNAEVDFVASFGGRIVPMEVKSGGRGSLRSLHQFMGEKNAPLAVRFDANPPSEHIVETTIQRGGKALDVRYRLLSLPLYLVEKVRELAAV
jgi:uncharacterized protein